MPTIFDGLKGLLTGWLTVTLPFANLLTLEGQLNTCVIFKRTDRHVILQHNFGVLLQNQLSSHTQPSSDSLTTLLQDFRRPITVTCVPKSGQNWACSKGLQLHTSTGPYFYEL
jgi:hypothetical protein